MTADSEREQQTPKELRSWYDIPLLWRVAGPRNPELTVRAIAGGLDLSLGECDELMQYVADHLMRDSKSWTDDWEITEYGTRVEALIDSMVSARVAALDRGQGVEPA
ncbi:MAG TPA: hypothetical protein VFK32_04150 [Tepidiformaceae bacterium]|nr:hypothetical protein [Tepidiformaceae bacterium]